MVDFPVFLLLKDCGEVELYASFEELQHELEPIDVENGEYEAWDRAGHPLRITSHSSTWLRLDPSREPVGTGLQAALLEYARREGLELTDDLQSMDAAMLLQRIQASKRRRGTVFSLISGRRTKTRAR